MKQSAFMSPDRLGKDYSRELAMAECRDNTVIAIRGSSAVPFREKITTILEPNATIMFAAEPTMTDTAKAEANLLNLLIVDDERAIRDGCREIAQTIGFSTFIADNAEHAYHVLETTGVDVALVDLRLPGTGGLEVLREIKRRRPETVVVVITGYATVQSAVQAMKNGAYDYVTKPFNLEELRLLLERVVGHLQLTSENRILREQIKTKEGFGSIVGRSPEMEKLYRIISKAAHSSHPVLILGESGTGKELVARSIHYSGPHRDQPFVPVDCGSLVPTLIESELFGYVKGAFTGANKAKDGLLAVAEGGTVFLDEVGELPIDLQAKLLRALQEKEIRPVGGTKAVPINARILAATNRDLEQAVTQGNFRRDLYFRLNVLTLRIPPLCSRKQDVPLLVGHFLERMTRSTGVQRNVSDEALKLMLAYDWPGNVRELQNSLERACALTSGPTIHAADLPTQIQTWRLQVESAAAAERAKAAHGILPIAEMEKRAILGAIEQLHGDKLEAARLLGIGKTTLYR
jgi:DNA-binding NtrC family response regulator